MSPEREGVPVGRLKRAADVLNAAELWKQRCLIDGGSLFTEEELWTRSRFEQLRTHFVEHPDSGSDSFEEKLRRQLDPAPPEAKRLWAEMTWAYDLIANNIKRVTKLDRIRTVWEWSGMSLPEGHEVLGEVLERGISNGCGSFT
jgi:5-methylcytosine-specific restriction protein B